ncbi:MAG TPA: aminoacyl-tRNA hydrolase [Candidatus Acidoferrales bacterium]|nr:aminoacyl-tRNA hydrolase [Candidatus Acidoferrales bacterium]
MWLIVGLGNPGHEYAWTPHNLGFLAIDLLAERAGIRVERPEAKSYVGKGRIGRHDVALAKPQTYMNLSGMAVCDLAGRFEAAPDRILIVVDDVALPWGSLRIRERGSAGGHNGLKSVIAALGSDEFIRLRLGIQPEYPVGDLAAYVTHRMGKAERNAAVELVSLAADAVECVVSDGVRRAMNRFNRRAPGSGEAS